MESNTESRVKSNRELFEVDQADFNAIEEIAAKKGQSYCNIDDSH